MTTENTVTVKRTLNESTQVRIDFHMNLINKQWPELCSLNAAGKSGSKGFVRKVTAFEKNCALVLKLQSQMAARIEKAAAKAPANDTSSDSAPVSVDAA